MNDPYEIAPGVLKNKYGITDPAKLAVVERAAAYQRILQLETQPIPGNFDFEHLKKIHQFILQDVYDWAGTLRTRDTGAVGMNLPHCRPEHIENQAAFIFRGIAKDNFPKDSRKTAPSTDSPTTGAKPPSCTRSETATPAHNESSSTNSSNPPAGPSTGRKSTPPQYKQPATSQWKQPTPHCATSSPPAYTATTPNHPPSPKPKATSSTSR